MWNTYIIYIYIYIRMWNIHMCDKVIDNKEVPNKKKQNSSYPVGEGRECNNKGKHKASRSLQIIYCLG